MMDESKCFKCEFESKSFEEQNTILIEMTSDLNRKAHLCDKCLKQLENFEKKESSLNDCE